MCHFAKLKEYKIRQVRKEDLPFIAKIESSSHPRPWTKADFEWEAANVCKQLQFWVVSNKAGEPVGYICFNFIVDEIYVRKLTVAESERRKGIGKSLIDICCLWGIRKGANRIVLDVRIGNKNGIKFYKKCGFSLVKDHINSSSRLMFKKL